MHAANFDPTLFSLHPPIRTRRGRKQQRGLSSTKISQNSFSAYSLNCIVLGLFSFSVRDFLEAFSILCFLRLHSRSTLVRLSSAGLPITSSEIRSQTYLLEPPPLAPPWCLSSDHFARALKVLVFKGFEMYQRRRANSGSTGCCHTHISVPVSVSIRYGTRTHCRMSSAAPH